jgi:small subunit ribosomal protein S16
VRLRSEFLEVIQTQVAVRIRLTRVGATKQPTYRFVVADSRNARDGRSLDTLGHYNPRTDPIEINVDEEKARDWLSRGAQPSDTVARLFRRVGLLPEEKPAPQKAKG